MASNRDRWKWRSSVMSMFALVSTTTIAPKLVLLSNLSGCREHGRVLRLRDSILPAHTATAVQLCEWRCKEVGSSRSQFTSGTHVHTLIRVC